MASVRLVLPGPVSLRTHASGPMSAAEPASVAAAPVSRETRGVCARNCTLGGLTACSPAQAGAKAHRTSREVMGGGQ